MHYLYKKYIIKNMFIIIYMNTNIKIVFLTKISINKIFRFYIYQHIKEHIFIKGI